MVIHNYKFINTWWFGDENLVNGGLLVSNYLFDFGTISGGAPTPFIHHIFMRESYIQSWVSRTLICIGEEHWNILVWTWYNKTSKIYFLECKKKKLNIHKPPLFLIYLRSWIKTRVKEQFFCGRIGSWCSAADPTFHLYMKGSDLIRALTNPSRL